MANSRLVEDRRCIFSARGKRSVREPSSRNSSTCPRAALPQPLPAIVIEIVHGETRGPAVLVSLPIWGPRLARGGLSMRGFMWIRDDRRDVCYIACAMKSSL